MAFTELTRVCERCYRPLPDPPATAVCDACGRAHCELFTAWPSVLKWWLLSELQSRTFSNRSTQNRWEDRIRSAMLENGLTKPNPWGLPISISTPTVELYPYALERAQAWKTAGSPIAVHVPFPFVPAVPTPR